MKLASAPAPGSAALTAWTTAARGISPESEGAFELGPKSASWVLRFSWKNRATAVGEDGTLELGDTLEQETIPSVELQLMKSSFERQIRTLVAELDEKERDVLRMRFGLDGEEPKTLQEIGEALGLSRERIRQIESKAKEKLRRSRHAQGLRGALN